MKLDDEKKEYVDRKRKLVELEKENYDKLIFMRGTKGYYLVAGNSAVILVNKIAKELKIRVTLKRDTDFDVKFKDGVANFRNLDFYKERFAQSSYLDFEKETKDFVFYKLKKPITTEEFDLLKHSKEIRKKKLESLIVKSVPMPGLNMKLTDAFSLTYKFYRKNSDAFSRAFIVGKLAEEMRTAHKTMLLISRDEMDFMVGIEQIRKLLSYVICDINQIMALEIWSIEDCTTLSISVIECVLQLDREVASYKKRKNKKDVRIE